jgi:integrase
LRAFLEEKGINSLAYVIPSRNAPVTFTQASEKWENGALELLKPSTRRTMKSQLRKHLRPALGDIPMDAFTPELVNDMVVKWHMKGLKRNTIKNFVTTLSLIRGKEFGKGAIKYPKQVDAEEEAPCFSPETMSAIVDREKAPMYKVFFATAAGTGMRSGELRGLRCGDVDLSGAIIHVRRSVWEGKEQSPKTKNGYRKVGIDASLVQILREYLGDRKLGYIFQTRRGTPLAGNNVVDRHLWPILEELEIPRCGLHAFRHGRVSFLVENNVPTSVIKQWIGHGSQRMIDLYTHSRPAFHQEALAKLPPMIVNILPTLTQLTQVDKKARAA